MSRLKCKQAPIKSLFILFIMLIISSCVSSSKFTQTIDFEKPEGFQVSPIDSASVKILEEQIPKGLTLKNNALEVEDLYAGQYAILGKIKTELKSGTNHPFAGSNSYLSKEDWTNLNYYCAYNPLGYLPLPLLLNIFNPFAWPCFFQSNKALDNIEDIEYRKTLLMKEARTIAAKKGANLIVAFQFGGMSVFDKKSAVELAHMHAFSASGYLVYVKK